LPREKRVNKYGEEFQMKLCKLAVLCVLFAGAFVQAHSQTQLRVDVPFNFTIGNHSLPAGQYKVQTAWSDSNLTWRISDQDGKSVFLTTNTVESLKAAHQPSLVFRKIGAEYSLVQFWLDGSSGRDVIRPKIANTVIAQSDFVEIAATSTSGR
jgi:hypothetical protein